MNKIIKFEATINEIVEFQLVHEDRMELINHILFGLCSDKQFNSFFKKLLKDLTETEKEFGKNEDKIKAYKSVINQIKLKR